MARAALARRPRPVVVETPAPATAPAPRPRRFAVGCLLICVGLGALMMFALGEPARNARAFQAAMRPGMSLGEAVTAARPHGRYHAPAHYAR